MISPEEVQKLANLSRIELSLEERSSFAKDIDSILEYVKQVREASAPSEHIVPKVRNVLRIDGEPHEGGLYTDAILNESPSNENGYIKVKKILNG